MKKVFDFIIKAITVAWLGAMLPAIIWAACAIKVGALSVGGALALGACYLLVLVMLGVLVDGGERK